MRSFESQESWTDSVNFGLATSNHIGAQPTMTDTHPLADVEAFLFDVFGTVVDWQGSVSEQLAARSDVKRKLPRLRHVSVISPTHCF